MRRVFYSTLLVLLVGTMGCDESFNPNADQLRTVVVYGVLTPDATQFIRVHPISNPSDKSPTNDSLQGVSIRVSDGTSTVIFQDTSLIAYQSESDPTNIPAFVAHNFTVQRGRSYSLTVQTPSFGSVTASLSVPSPSFLTTTGSTVIQDPWGFSNRFEIVVSSLLSPETKGYFVRFFLDYDVLKSGLWVGQRTEVPFVVQDSVSLLNINGIYPSLELRTTVRVGRNLPYEDRSFQNLAYQMVLKLIYEQYGSQNIRMKEAVFQLVQVEDNLFNYYFVSNHFGDRFSIRVDKPEYSNVIGGYGVFGAFTVDSLIQNLPQDLTPR